MWHGCIGLRGWLFRVALVLLSLCSATAGAQKKLARITLAGPLAAVSSPLVCMAKRGALAEITDSLEFVYWHDAEQMQQLVAQRQVDFIVLPTPEAAKLYNQGVDLKLLNVASWGALWIVSRQSGQHKFLDLKGETIAIPAAAGMSGDIFSVLAQQQGLNVEQDFHIRSVSDPAEAINLLLTRRVDHALLLEPAASMALRKSKTFPFNIFAPDLHRSVDLQREWGRLFWRQGRIPRSAVVLVNPDLPDRAIERVVAAYEQAARECAANPQRAAVLIAEQGSLFSQAVADSVATSQIEPLPATQAKHHVQHFLQILHRHSPTLVGGKLPDDDFYYRMAQ